MPRGSFTITPTGPFSLAETATLGFGQRVGGDWDGVMRLAFCLDGYTGQVAVEVRQDGTGPGRAGPDQAGPDQAGPDQAGPDQAGPDQAGPDQAGPDQAGTVHCVVHGPAGVDLGRVHRQVARVLSLDHDGREFSRVGERDPVIGRLQAAAPGLRPPLFYSPYEAAVWCVLSARRPARQMMQVRDRLGRAHGTVFELAGQQLPALPTPDQLLAVDSFAGIPADRMPRLHGVARAALAGRLDADRLLDQGPVQAMAGLQELSGIGPFYSSLIVARGTGFTDVLAVGETRVLDLAARLYQLKSSPSEAAFRALAEPWRPLRTWAVVLIRAAADRVPGGAGASAGVR